MLQQQWARNGEKAQSAPLIIIMFILLCGFAGLTIDVGYGMLQKRRLQAAVDMGLLSGARVMPNTSDAATVSNSYVRDNFNRSTDQAVAVNTTTGCMVSGCVGHDRLNLVATTNTPTFFARLFGIDQWTVRARGSACGPCDSSPVSYDVIIVLDRSNSMCTTGSGSSNGCSDLANAKEGIRELLQFFDPATDRVGLAVLGSSDTNACPRGNTAMNCPSSHGPYSHTTPRPGLTWQSDRAYTPPECDGANPSIPSGSGRFYRSNGDFMDGTASN
ncbi:MAG: tad-like Flp pilus-assembly family protein, partial [Thermoleophilia bacterium]|nr:tad-like Flp pilus-assembly family protein [Thermoleophilia bacterium]